MGGTNVWIMGITSGDKKNVVAPEAIAICCVSQEFPLLLLSLLMLLICVVLDLDARSLSLFLLLPSLRLFSLDLLPKIFDLPGLVSPPSVRKEENALETVLLSRVARADAMTSSSISRVMSDGCSRDFGAILLLSPAVSLLSPPHPCPHQPLLFAPSAVDDIIIVFRCGEVGAVAFWGDAICMASALIVPLAANASIEKNNGDDGIFSDLQIGRCSRSHNAASSEVGGDATTGMENGARLAGEV